jgi:hypothetical protein
MAPLDCQRESDELNWAGISSLHTGGAGFSYLLELISRIRAVNDLPSNSLKVPYCGESTTRFTTAGLRLAVMFSRTPRNPKYEP